MYSDSRPKDNPLNWSFRIGSLFGITIRLHLFFILGAVILIGFSFKNASEGAGIIAFVESVGQIFILFFIVLVHEFGHCWGSRKTGGEADEILLWPLGGLAMVRPKHTPYANLITTVAGPMVNVIFCAVSAVALVILHRGIGAVPWNPLNTFAPIDATVDLGDPVQRWIRVFFGLSYIILLFNLLPIYPLDGGRVLHCYLWPRKGYHDATMAATFIGMVGAIVLGLAGLLTGATLMLIIAFFGYITCYSDRRAAKWSAAEGDSGEFGYDFSKGYTAFEEESPARKPGYFERRKQEKEIARQQQEEEERERLRRQADEILLKVHKSGMGSLTREERRILEKETQRQRSESS